jgi:hypothetical protein
VKIPIPLAFEANSCQTPAWETLSGQVVLSARLHSNIYQVGYVRVRGCVVCGCEFTVLSNRCVCALCECMCFELFMYERVCV